MVHHHSNKLRRWNEAYFSAIVFQVNQLNDYLGLNAEKNGLTARY
jgi:hypothetical protein